MMESEHSSPQEAPPLCFCRESKTLSLSASHSHLAEPEPKIQRVPRHLRHPQRFPNHYSPTLVSFGPIHHGNEKLQRGEKYKLRWAYMFLKRTKQDAETLLSKIEANVEQLKGLFEEDAIGGFSDDGDLSWMLFVDGCSLLQILDRGKLDGDSRETLNVIFHELLFVMQDVLLLENQLPYQLLKLLSGHENDDELLRSMNEFLQWYEFSPVLEQRAEEGCASVCLKNEDTLQGGEHRVEIPLELPVHLLDQLRRCLLHDPHKNHQDDEKKDMRNEGRRMNEDSNLIRYKNIRELKAAGIRVKKSNSRSLSDVSFSCGWFHAELKLPEVIVSGATFPVLLNLIAYEMCSGFGNNREICSFLAFMNFLVDHPDDVKELRLAGVLHNVRESDEKVVKLFKTISTDVVDGLGVFLRVRPQIEKHYWSKMWIALGYRIRPYFCNPWAVLAAIYLVLTFINTWFAIMRAC